MLLSNSSFRQLTLEMGPAPRQLEDPCRCKSENALSAHVGFSADRCLDAKQKAENMENHEKSKDWQSQLLGLRPQAQTCPTQRNQPVSLAKAL